MDNVSTSQSILSGILAGNDTLARWTGEEWVCDRGSVEYLLVSGVADRFLADMPGWHVWPEIEAGDDFNYVGTNYRKHVNDCPPRYVFGGVRYDLGLLRSPRTISGLVEIKRYWTTEDLTKLARALFYLGIKPPRVPNGVKEGVLLESVFFGAFIWHEPSGAYANEPLEAQHQKIKTEIDTWWQGATAGGGDPIQTKFQTVCDVCPKPKISFRSKSGTGSKGQREAGAVCVCLSLDEDR